MKTVIRQYPKICEHCKGKGQIWDNTDSTSSYTTCPVCKGVGTITVTETIFEGDDYIPESPPPYKVTCKS